MTLTDKVALGAGAAIVAVVVVIFAGRKLADTAAKAANAVNPLNHDNIFATGVNDLGANLTGDKDFTLGGWFYDFTHADPLKQAPTPKPEPVPAIDQPTLGFGA